MISRKVNGINLASAPTEILPHDFVDTEIIADPLNGLIPISAFEKRIICCSEFQRLRRIKQLGFANLVYPAAEYSRFVHSLGACHQAKNIVDTVNENLRNNSRYRKWRVFGKDDGKEQDYSAVAIFPFERVLIAAAALLHDLSHGPFSHEIEGILGEDGRPVIPNHDSFQRNPALFLYFFDTKKSELARLLEHFNTEFSAGLIKSSASANRATPDRDCRFGIRSLLDSGILTKKGTIKLDLTGPLQLLDVANNKWKRKELPLLPVLIFEILLFEKQDEWLSPEDQRQILGTRESSKSYGVQVSTDWEGSSRILWRPINGWFRAYRKDIIGNTICADLTDYVSRDGYHTGIVSTMDLKFLDRMLIARATLPPIGEDGQATLKPPSNKVPYEDIPVACEHIVFDIYDHKRGFIRQSVLTEILAYLQGRYLLCERVYVHRVVEAARSMLQQAVGILSGIKRSDAAEEPLLSLRDLHPLDDDRGSAAATAPIGDEALLTWIRALPTLERKTYEKHRAEIDQAIELATMLVERRVFREAIIYDGIHGFEGSGQLAGAKATCRALEAAFLTDAKLRNKLGETQEAIDEVLDSALSSQSWNNGGENAGSFDVRVMSLLSVRKWGKRYKPPLVLVARPLKKAAHHSALDIEPLLDCEDPPNIKKQLDALKDSYDGLWKVYLFVHPVFHQESFRDAHVEIDKKLGTFAAEHTGSPWRNAIDFEQLLPRKAIDNKSLLAQASSTPGRIDVEGWNRPWTAENVVSLLKPLTARDVENLTALRLRCELFVGEIRKFPTEQQAAIGKRLMRITTYAPKVPFVVNRFSAEQIDRRLRAILDTARGRDETEADE